MKKYLLLTVCSLIATSSVYAEDINKLTTTRSPWVLSMRAGTLGVGPEIMYHPQYSHWGVRADFDTYNVGFNDVYKNKSNFRANYEGASVNGRLTTNYSGNVKLMNGSIYGDYYPWKHSAFRLTGGLTFNSNQLSVDGNASATGMASFTKDITLSQVVRGHTVSKTFSRTFSQDVSYSNAGNVRGNGKYNFVSPYLGIGFNTEIAKGFYFNSDLGAMFQGSTNINLHATGLMTNVNGYQKSVEVAQNKIQKYMNYMAPVYPVLMIGFGYRF